MSQDYILAIDHGTQSVRALLFDLNGNLAARSRVVIEPYYSVQPGWAEQRPEYFWDSLCQACQQLWALSDIPKAAIKGVALTTQRATMINVDSEGQSLRPAIVWLDQRRAKGIPPLGGAWGLLFKLLGLQGDIKRFQAEAEPNWIRQNEPEIWDKTCKYLFLSGYLTYQLTGRFVDSVGGQVGCVPFDAKKLDWAAPSDWKWRTIPLDRAMLPDLIAPAGRLGEISAQAAAATGIPAGLPLIAAAADKACEVLGSGSLQPNIGCLSYGTTATFTTIQPTYLEVIPPLPPFPAAVPGSYNPEVVVNRGYWMVSWFKDQFGYEERQRAQELGIEPEQLFDLLVNQVPPGSMGLMLQPYWSPGVKTPSQEAKGAILGFGDVHTRAHVYRAILEGVAYALREGKERTERRSGVAITELRVSGGGSRSDAALQLTADIFGLPTARSHTSETSGLGAAIDAAVGLGFYPNFDAAVRSMTRIERTFSPCADAQTIYDQLYDRIYKRMYGTLRQFYTDIQKITGYPELIG